ncbi:MAG: Gfo/Idh/MocA family oxidoreductase [Candidatus Hydrogenedentes bacterium]|nr:Gfo/Idh/MocA family oxidoreductase [Candidatus Hydrogenedentota bacterium]
MSHSASRRNFLKTATTAGAVFSFVPSKVFGANEKVNLACIGIGGRGKGLVPSLYGKGANANVVALCDVDIGSKRTQDTIGRFPKAPQFKDFRKMFDKMGDQIDAVSIAVPDHSHFPIAIYAMSLGKHVYVEKPLAHTFNEIELLMAAEKKYKVVTQMGNQGHSGNNYYQFKKWTEAGIIKDVTKVTAFMNKNRRWYGWKINGYPKGEICPETLDWDLWLTTALYHDYSEKLADGNWRSWFDFGDGAFGDWGPHTLDTIHQFLDLGLPSEINADHLEQPNRWIYPQASTISFQFPKRGKMPPVKITWYDGIDNLPPRPKELEPGRKMGTCGKIIFSKDLVFKGGTHSDTLRIIPESKMKEMAPQLPTTNEKHSNHYQNFILACKGEEETHSPFSISGPLSQMFVLGCMAQRLNTKLVFDRKTKQITNNKVANELLVGPPPRKGWEEYYRLT